MLLRRCHSAARQLEEERHRDDRCSAGVWHADRDERHPCHHPPTATDTLPSHMYTVRECSSEEVINVFIQQNKRDSTHSAAARVSLRAVRDPAQSG